MGRSPSQSLTRAVFLDRDGVINASVVRDGKPYPPASVAELEILPGVFEALARLRRAGFLLIVVTNQPDVGRGTQDRTEVEAMHAYLLATLPLDEVKVSYTATDHEGCTRRKPAPGMLAEAATECGIELSISYMVGDRWRDIEAGLAAGCRTVFIDYGYDERRPQSYDFKVASLAEAADAILITEGWEK